ncbi:SidE phosphodiesterase domain-containing protein [Endozoicomonas gorgoniicola]|uniref:SidE phosphodiesterase domain-containing protein n=1 Tax=Endozoicomonas gorgoniicola TaxID=1234144 RepID=A0ABT3MT10_9GAMM|nr:SidE phosphodiesterase domain-containing protein [Endozoicomonas gorgoniicola]MCW7552521.1 SidE phosphodiesterase domain-containing protein [Endozoicomonas gorgoniicola]
MITHSSSPISTESNFSPETEPQAGLSETSSIAQVPPGSAYIEQNRDGVSLPTIPLGERSLKSLGTGREPAYHCGTAQFFEVTQSLVHRFLQKPLPGQTVLPDEIARPVHGAMHGARAALWIPILLNIRQSMNDPEAKAVSPEQVHWLMTASLFHDSGREGEGEDTPEWERTSAEQCEDHLLAMGCPHSMVAACKSSIINKDRSDRSAKTLVEKLIHDADCLEIMRTSSGNRFDLAELDLYHDFSAEPDIDSQLYNLASQVRDVIAQQGDLSGTTQIINSKSGFSEQKEKAVRHHFSTAIKERAEFADNALLYQVDFLKEKAPELFKMYQDTTPPLPDSEELLSPVKAVELNKNGKADNGKYLVRERKNPDSARNEVLMANLARELGLSVPETRLVRKEGRFFVVSSEVTGSPMTKELAQEADPAELAKLYLVAAVTGNSNIIGADHDQTIMDENGQLIPLYWQEAGEFGSAGGEQRKAGTFCSTVFELDTLLNPGHSRTESTVPEDSRAAHHNAATLFSQRLSEADIKNAVRDLLSKDVTAIARLVETMGPDTAIDRQRLSRTLMFRLACLARRFPECCPEPITAAEQGAIAASGMQGYSRPVADSGIENGDLRIYQFMDVQKTPVTACWLKLEPQAARQLADRLGLPDTGMNDLHYLRTCLDELSQKPAMNPYWRVKLQTMDRRCQHLIQTVEAGLVRYRLPQDRRRAEQALESLNGLRCQIADALECEDKKTLAIRQQLPAQLPEGLPIRVTSIAFTPVEGSTLPAREFRNGRGWENGKEVVIDRAHHYQLDPEAFLPHECLKERPGIEIDWFSDDLADNFSMAGTLHLRTSGNDCQATKTLLDAVAQLGIDIERPDSEAMQAQYVDSLINHYQLNLLWEQTEPESLVSESLEENKSNWLKSQLKWPETPRWEDHHRILNGQCIFYLPNHVQKKSKDGKTEPAYEILHELNFLASGSQERESVIERIIHSGGNCVSITERFRLGVNQDAYASKLPDLKSGSGAQVFAAVRESGGHKPDNFLKLKQDHLLRTDINSKGLDMFGEPIPELQHHGLPAQSPSALEAGFASAEISSRFISLEEVEEIAVPEGEKITGKMKATFDGGEIAQFIRCGNDFPDMAKNKLPGVAVFGTNMEITDGSGIHTLKLPEELRFVYEAEVTIDSDSVLVRAFNYDRNEYVSATFVKGVEGWKQET